MSPQMPVSGRAVLHGAQGMVFGMYRALPVIPDNPVRQYGHVTSQLSYG